MRSIVRGCIAYGLLSCALVFAQGGTYTPPAGSLPPGTQGFVVSNQTGANTYATSAMGGFDTTTISGSDRCAAIHTAWVNVSATAPINAISEALNETSQVLNCLTNPFPVTASFGGTDAESSTAGGGLFQLPVGQINPAFGLQLGANGVTIRGVSNGYLGTTYYGSWISSKASGWSNFSGAGATCSVISTFICGNYNPFSLALGAVVGYGSTVGTVVGPYKNLIDQVSIQSNSIAGVGGVSFIGQELNNVTHMTVTNARATGFYVTADSADAQAIEHLYVQHPATGSVESNATAAGSLSWIADASGNVLLTWGNSPSATPGCGMTVEVLGAAASGGYNPSTNPVHVVAALVDSSNHLLLCDKRAATVSAAIQAGFNSTGKQLVFIDNNTTVASQATNTGATAGFFTVGLYANAFSGRTFSDISLVSNNTDFSSGIMPFCEAELSGSALVAESMHTEEGTNGVCVGLDDQVVQFKLVNSSPYVKLTNGVHLFPNFGACLGCEIETSSDAAISVTNTFVDDYNSITLTAANNPSIKYKSGFSGAVGDLEVWASLCSEFATSGGSGKCHQGTTVYTYTAGVIVGIDNDTAGTSSKKGSTTPWSTLSSSAVSNAYTVSPSPVITSLTNLCLQFIAAAGNTGPATLAINTLTAKAITKNGATATALASGDIGAGQTVHVCYDGTQFEMMSPIANPAAGGGANQQLSNLSNVAVNANLEGTTPGAQKIGDTTAFGDTVLNQTANGDDTLYMQRNTNTSPTGNFLHFQSAGNTPADIFVVDVAGNLTTQGNATITGNTAGTGTGVFNGGVTGGTAGTISGSIYVPSGSASLPSAGGPGWTMTSPDSMGGSLIEVKPPTGATGLLGGTFSGSIYTEEIAPATFDSAGNAIINTYVQIPNDTTTGTTLHSLVRLLANGAVNSAITAGTSTGNKYAVVGICVNGCGTTGSATIQITGLASCTFDSAPAAVNNYVIPSATTGGDCSDFGSATVVPTSSIASPGQVWSTTAVSGSLYSVFLRPPPVIGMANPMTTANDALYGGTVTDGIALPNRTPCATPNTVFHGGTPPACTALTTGDLPTAIPIGNVGSSGLSGTPPVTVASTGAVACPTCVTSQSTTAQTQSFTNDTTTGTTTNSVVRLLANGAVNSVITTTTAITKASIVGICISGCGTTGSANIAMAGSGGTANCTFDGTPAAVNDFVVVSTTTAGDCHDNGSTTVQPSDGSAVLGRVNSTTAVSGSIYTVLLVDAPVAPMVNPMTTAGDLMHGGTVTNGISAPARLGIGTAFQSLQVNSGATDTVWANTVGMIPGGQAAAATYTAATWYLNPLTPGSNSGASGADAISYSMQMPTNGTITAMYANMSVAPGTTSTAAFTLHCTTGNSGACTAGDTTITCTFASSSAVECSDTAHSQAFSAGDYINIKMVIGTATTASTRVSVELKTINLN